MGVSVLQRCPPNIYRESNKTRTEWGCPSYKGVHPKETQITLVLNEGVRHTKVSTL